MKEHTYYVYIVASPSRTIYTGVMNDLERRMWQHKQKTFRGFTAQHSVTRLVWFEEYRMVDDAIAREKQIKGWRREKKLALIEAGNPKWRDLSHDWFDRRRATSCGPPRTRGGGCFDAISAPGGASIGSA